MSELIGKTISHYKIITKLGEGGMGVVYKAEDTKLKRTVALKFLSVELIRSTNIRERFVNEARAASVLSHPNICTIHDFEETDDGQLFIVMAYCQGDTLKNKIIKGDLKIDEIVDLSMQIANGLAEAHEQGIVHRDIKPANLIITKKDEVKIVDFGLARITDVSLHTKTGASFGTLNYMSPEQACGEKLDRRTDIWSFGVSLYEMLTGQLPFHGEYERAVVHAIMYKDAPPMAGSRRAIPEGLERIVNKAMAKRPEDRYQHADDMLVELRQVKRSMEPKYRTVIGSGIPRKKAKSFFLPVIITAVLLLLYVGYWFIKKEPVSKPPIAIAVADFINETNEEELNGLSGMLITALEQSRQLSVLTRSRMFDILKQLRKGKVERVDEPTAREICKHANVNALVIASIRKFDQLYTIDLKVIDPIKDQYLFTAGEKGEGKASVPAMIDKLSEKTQNGLKIQDIEKASSGQGVAAVTTANLEAYYHFFKGMEFWYKLQANKAEEELNNAITIDSTFGLPYALLAIIKIGTPDEHLAREPLSKALRYLNRTPVKERYLIRAIDAYFKKGHKAAIDELKDMSQLYPDDKRVYLGLGYFYLKSNHYLQAKENFDKALELDPTFEMALYFLSKTVMAMK